MFNSSFLFTRHKVIAI